MAEHSTTQTPTLSLSKRQLPLAAPSEQLKRLFELDLPPFADNLNAANLSPYRPTQLQVLQVNVGKLCNQTCRHCHVDAGPDRTEVMSKEIMQACLDVLANSDIPSVDITGGAPELVPHFRWFVSQCRALGRHVMDRCNLTVLESRKHTDLPEFFAEHQVEVVASLPHYRSLNTDKQRGPGVFEKSIAGLRKLNAVGYGKGDPNLRLVLVTNPVGAFLPPAQASLEKEWKRELKRLHNVEFDALYTITNMPISRYLEWLIDSDNLQPYLERLVNAFNPNAASKTMCRTTLSVGYDGQVYDCDFNQMLELPVTQARATHIRDFDLQAFMQRTIRVAPHCYGCTAGAGSSCGGETV